MSVLSLVFLVLYWQLARRERAQMVDSKVGACAMLADVFARSLQAPLEFRDEDAIAAELKNLDGNPDIRSVLVWADGPQPIAHLGLLLQARRPEGDLASVEESTFALSRRVFSRSGDVVGAIRLEMSLRSELAAYQRVRLGLLLGAAVLAFGTSGLLVGIVRRQVVIPLRRVISAAAAIGSGQLSARVPPGHRDEIGEMAAAFNRMADSLEDRELRLESATRDLRELFDHMRQAIVAFDDLGLVVSQPSRQAEHVFGSAHLEGRSIRELLYANAPPFDVEVQAFDEWVGLAFQTAPDDWDTIHDLAPKELCLGPSRIPVTLEFRPVVRRGRTLHVMLLATDVSHERQLEQTVQTKDAEHARRMTAMRRLLTGGSQVFVAFVESAHARLSRATELVSECGPLLGSPTIDALFRDAHTVRGEARAFDMIDLERETERIEEGLDELRAAARGDGVAMTDSLRARLTEGFRATLVALERERQLFVEASPVGQAIFNQVPVQRQDLLDLVAYASRTGGELRTLVDRLRARPLGESVSGLFGAAPAWALAEGKRVELVIEQGEAPVAPVLAPALPGILAHLVRNAVAHGIESPADRRARGKAEEGTIRIAAQVDAKERVSFFVEDDGRGVDIEALRRRTSDSTSSLVDLLSRPGLSTREKVDALAGRGVGLDAVRTEAERAGYVVSITTESGRFTRVTLSPSLHDPGGS